MINHDIHGFCILAQAPDVRRAAYKSASPRLGILDVSLCGLLSVQVLQVSGIGRSGYLRGGLGAAACLHHPFFPASLPPTQRSMDMTGRPRKGWWWGLRGDGGECSGVMDSGPTVTAVRLRSLSFHHDYTHMSNKAKTENKAVLVRDVVSCVIMDICRWYYDRIE